VGSVATRLDEIVQIVQTMLHGRFRSAFQSDAAIIAEIRQNNDISAFDVAILIHAMRNISASLQKYIS